MSKPEEKLSRITHIRHLTLVARDRDGAVVGRVSRDDLRLGYGERLVVPTPAADGAESYTLSAEGYYEPLGAVVATMPPR